MLFVFLECNFFFAFGLTKPYNVPQWQKGDVTEEQVSYGTLDISQQEFST